MRADQEKERQQALEAEAAKQAAATRDALDDLRLTTLSEWAGSVGGLITGLNTAQGMGEVADITLIYRPEDLKTWSSAFDNLGRLAGVSGAAIAAVGANNDKRAQLKNGLLSAGSGLLLHYVVDLTRTYSSNGSGALRTYTERVIMYKNFSSQVTALKASLDSIVSVLMPLQATATRLAKLATEHPDSLKKFTVSHTLVAQYETSLDAYTTVVSQLRSANATATDLLQNEQGWTAPISGSLKKIRSATQTAIRDWTDQTRISKSQLRNLNTLADHDDPPK